MVSLQSFTVGLSQHVRCASYLPNRRVPPILCYVLDTRLALKGFKTINIFTKKRGCDISPQPALHRTFFEFTVLIYWPVLNTFLQTNRSDILGKLDCFRLAGLDLWFHSSDHEPPHFHARKPDKWEIRVFFGLCTERELVFNVKFPRSGEGPSGKEQRDILNRVLQHRDALYVEWENKVKTRS